MILKDQLVYLCRRVSWCLVLIAALSIALDGAALAQQSPEDEAADEAEAAEEELLIPPPDTEEVVVTGSRIRRASPFNSSSPISVIEGDDNILTGSLDPAQILRQSTSVTGQQIDSSFAGFVTNGGPGAETLGLRGLGPERTLVLMDSRRIGAAGVQGGAVFVDISLIPSFLINRAEILLSGASSIYGADAVAGVVNVITPTEFEGVEVNGNWSVPEVGAGEEQRYSLELGQTFENARFYMGFEFFDRNVIRPSDTDFAADGTFTLTRNPMTGEITRTPTGLIDQAVAFTPFCIFSSITPGETNIGVPNFSCLGGANPQFIGNPAVNNTFDNNSDLFSPQTRWSGYAKGEYDLEELGGMTLFAELLITNRETITNGGNFQFFPSVPATNAFNPFGPFILDFAPGCADDPATPAFEPGSSACTVVPVAVESIRDPNQFTDVTYQRFAGGIKGDLHFLNDGALPFDNWTYEVSVGYTRSNGVTRFQGIRNDRLTASLRTFTDPVTGEISCDSAPFDLFGGIAPDCVPVNLFSSDFLLDGMISDEARDFLVTDAVNRTIVEQTAIEVGVTGDLFELPAGPVALFLGASWRDDVLNSDPDSNIEQNNLWGRSSEADTVGSAVVKELYAETEIPVLSGRQYVENLFLNGSVRFTDDEFFGSEATWRITGGYWPTTWLRFRGTAGTSFRAPNLRERFLAGQTGFASGFIDPCIPPAVPPDNRSQTVIDNCMSEGVNPFALGSGGAPSVTTITGGTTELSPETSDSWTVGFAMNQPWTDAFDLSFSFDFTSIDITNGVAQPSAGFILSQCYNSVAFSDPLCDRVTRDLSAPPSQRFLSLIDTSFANIEVEEVRDISFSVLFVDEFEIGGELFRVSLDADATRLLAFENGLFIATANDQVGDIGTPNWQVLMSGSINWNRWTFIYDMVYQSAGENPSNSSGQENNAITSIGGFDAHTFGIVYECDTWRAFFTVENIFDAHPDLVDDEAFFSNTRNNIPLGVYPSEALFGRTFLFGVRKNFNSFL